MGITSGYDMRSSICAIVEVELGCMMKMKSGHALDSGIVATEVNT